jgi:hypothetical protein
MSPLKRWLIGLFFILSLGAMMGQDGFCFFAGDEGDGVIITDDDVDFF